MKMRISVLLALFILSAVSAYSAQMNLGASFITRWATSYLTNGGLGFGMVTVDTNDNQARLDVGAASDDGGLYGGVAFIVKQPDVKLLSYYAGWKAFADYLHVGFGMDDGEYLGSRLEPFIRLYGYKILNLFDYDVRFDGDNTISGNQYLTPRVAPYVKVYPIEGLNLEARSGLQFVLTNSGVTNALTNDRFFWWIDSKVSIDKKLVPFTSAYVRFLNYHAGLGSYQIKLDYEAKVDLSHELIGRLNLYALYNGGLILYNNVTTGTTNAITNVTFKRNKFELGVGYYITGNFVPTLIVSYMDGGVIDTWDDVNYTPASISTAGLKIAFEFPYKPYNDLLIKPYFEFYPIGNSGSFVPSNIEIWNVGLRCEYAFNVKVK